MDWIINNITEGIWGFFAKLCSNIINEAFKFITETIINITDINKYININKYLVYIQIIAASFLLVRIAWEALKYQSGGVLGGNNGSISALMIKVLQSGAAIYVLPYLVIDVLLPINNALMKFIQAIGFEITEEHFSKTKTLVGNLSDLGQLMILVLLILGIGFLILAIAGSIRYIELLICILFAPIAAVSIVNDGEGAEVWFKETICIVFTQSIHMFLLQILITIMTTVDGIMMAILCIASISIMLKGPQVLRNFLYTSGAGSISVKTAGTAARGYGKMRAMKRMVKSSSPIGPLV
ncbi:MULTISPECIES: conjugal transfer protein TrbL family protein [unclassified Clostridium]|uniref:conjugal transfer protein TrbL family protein n=1 Tax=unclassified Clostridium TaxID=2614128 RepID=UPI0025B8333A|nr:MULTISPECIES: conjugal transfer protein TrbL family protein [unclassified Clostridium]